MRTTLDIDDEVLARARALAAHERISLGEAVSRLAARGLRTGLGTTSTPSGFPIFTATGHTITDETVQTHRDD